MPFVNFEGCVAKYFGCNDFLRCSSLDSLPSCDHIVNIKVVANFLDELRMLPLPCIQVLVNHFPEKREESPRETEDQDFVTVKRFPVEAQGVSLFFLDSNLKEGLFEITCKLKPGSH